MEHNPTPKPTYNTLDLYALVPEEWRDAPLAIADGIGGADGVVRISLHSNACGRVVIVLHTKQLLVP